MKEVNYISERNSYNGPEGAHAPVFENLVWLTTRQAAIFLGRFDKDGCPATNAIRNLVWRGKLKAKKYLGRLYFKKDDLMYLIETSPTIGGFNGS